MVRVPCTYLLNVEALHARLSAEPTEQNGNRLTGFSALMSSHSSFETSALKEDWRGT